MLETEILEYYQTHKDNRISLIADLFKVTEHKVHSVINAYFKPPRAGSVKYKDSEIPLNAKPFISKSGHECYVSGLSADTATVFVFDKKEFITVPRELINKHL
jgi:hypothetical protein